MIKGVAGHNPDTVNIAVNHLNLKMYSKSELEQKEFVQSKWGVFSVCRSADMQNWFIASRKDEVIQITKYDVEGKLDE